MSEREFVAINEEAARTAQNTRRTSTKYMIWRKK